MFSSLLASSALGKLRESISDLAGLSSVLTYDRADDLALKISMGVPGEDDLNYYLRLRRGQGYDIEELLSQTRRPSCQSFTLCRAPR